MRFPGPDVGNYNQCQAWAEDSKGSLLQLTVRMTERRQTDSLPKTIAWVGVGGLNPGQTQVEFIIKVCQCRTPGQKHAWVQRAGTIRVQSLLDSTTNWWRPQKKHKPWSSYLA